MLLNLMISPTYIWVFIYLNAQNSLRLKGQGQEAKVKVTFQGVTTTPKAHKLWQLDCISHFWMTFTFERELWSIRKSQRSHSNLLCVASLSRFHILDFFLPILKNSRGSYFELQFARRENKVLGATKTLHTSSVSKTQSQMT